MNKVCIARRREKKIKRFQNWARKLGGGARAVSKGGALNEEGITLNIVVTYF